MTSHVLVTNQWISGIKKGSTDGVMKQIGDQLRKHPEQRLPLSALDPLSKIVHGNNIVLYVCNKTPNTAALRRDNYLSFVTISRKQWPGRGFKEITRRPNNAD